MKVCGIIAEYDPFHSGHKYHLEQTAARYGATHFIAVMSGNFTQRGDAAVFDKYRRARLALENGIDLVIELPLPYVLASAEQFALGGVALLQGLGCVDMLSFGSECGDIGLLQEAAGAVLYAQEQDEFFGMMKNGYSFPAALQKTIEKYYTDDIAEALTTPNNTLAVEYLKAMGELGSTFKAVTVKRLGAEHDGAKTNGGYASASLIRRKIRAGEDISAYVPWTPDFERKDTADIRNLETAILAKLRTMPKTEIAKAPNVLMGLENRIHKAARVSTSLAELYFLTKTKRYTMARIRRTLLSCFLGVQKSDLKGTPPYVHILGMNAKGKEILAAVQCELPIDTSLKALMSGESRQKRFAALEAQAGDIYALAFEKKRVCGLDFTAKPVILS